MNPVAAQANYVTFSGFNPKPESIENLGDCTVCLESLKTGVLVAHEGNGQKHPYHADCLEDYFNETDVRPIGCPNCKARIKGTDPLNFTEYASESLTRILTDGGSNLIFGVPLGLICSYAGETPANVASCAAGILMGPFLAKTLSVTHPGKTKAFRAVRLAATTAILLTTAGFSLPTIAAGSAYFRFCRYIDT